MSVEERRMFESEIDFENERKFDYEMNFEDLIQIEKCQTQKVNET